jgi:hypothetical protein
MPTRKKTKVLYIPYFFLVIYSGESQMIKSDKGKKVLGAIVILAIIVSVFGGAVSAVDLSGGNTECY